MPASSKIGFALAFLSTGAAADVTELVAMQPAGGGGAGTTIEWVAMSYPDNVTSASDVSLEAVSTAESAQYLEAWDGIDLETSLMLTGHVYGEKFYGYINTGVAPGQGSCCADTMRIWDKSGDYTDIDLVTPMEAIFADSDYDYATHTFYLDEYNGETVAFCMAQFETPDLGNAPVDVIVAISMESGEVVQTKAGDDYFSFWEKLGTTSTDLADSVFKVQHYSMTTKDYQAYKDPKSVGNAEGNAEEWHGNGISRWTMQDGTDIMAITHKSLSEAILISDPWADASNGEILQRFGSPSGHDTVHNFGLTGGESFNGVHNIIYGHDAASGRESATIFVNAVDGTSYSWVFEFDINLVKEAEVTGTISDSVFDTTYRSAACPFQTDTQGGARPISMGADGSVWAVASGSGQKGLVVVDQEGGSTSYSSTIAYYDPFSFITVEN